MKTLSSLAIILGLNALACTQGTEKGSDHIVYVEQAPTPPPATTVVIEQPAPVPSTTAPQAPVQPSQPEQPASPPVEEPPVPSTPDVPVTPGSFAPLNHFTLAGHGVKLGGGRGGFTMGYTEKLGNGHTVLHGAALSEQGDLLFDGRLPYSERATDQRVERSFALGTRGFSFSYYQQLSVADGSTVDNARTVVLGSNGELRESAFDLMNLALSEGNLVRYGSWLQNDGQGNLTGYYTFASAPTLGTYNIVGDSSNATAVDASLTVYPNDFFSSGNGDAYYLVQRCIQSQTGTCSAYEFGAVATSHKDYTWFPILQVHVNPNKSWDAWVNKFVFVPGTNTLYLAWNDNYDHKGYNTNLTEISLAKGVGLTRTFRGYSTDIVGIGNNIVLGQGRNYNSDRDLTIASYGPDFRLIDTKVIASTANYYEGPTLAVTGNNVVVQTCVSVDGGPCGESSTVDVFHVN